MRPDRHPHHRLLLPWVALAATCMALMLIYPGGETVPYHVGWIGLGLAYGLDPWPLRWASAAVVGYAVTTGAVLVDRAAHGVIAWEETTEIPLMAILVILMVWHAHRRLSAFAALDRLHRHERTRAERREWMAGLVSHEIKTTVTVAGGYLELVAAATTEPTTRAHVEVARDELHSLTRASERLIRMMGMQENFPLESVDGADILGQVVERWSAVADRDWAVDVEVGQIACAPQRLRACFDTLIENSLRHTPAGGRIRLVGLRLSDHVCLGVADSGPGFSAVQLETINQLGPQRVDGRAGEHYRPQGGLGLSLVHELAIERGGRLAVGRSAEGGALVLIVLPAAAVSVEERPSAGHVRSLTQPRPMAGLVASVVPGPRPPDGTSRAEEAPSYIA